MTVDREPQWTATPAPQSTDVPLCNRVLTQASVRRVVDRATACFPVNARCSKKKSLFTRPQPSRGVLHTAPHFLSSWEHPRAGLSPDVSEGPLAAELRVMSDIGDSSAHHVSV